MPWEKPEMVEVTVQGADDDVFVVFIKNFSIAGIGSH